MKDIIINVSRETRMVALSKKEIGNEGENLQGKLIFRFDESINGVGRLEFSVNGNKMYAMLNKEDDTYTLPIESVLTTEGQILMQLVITENSEDNSIPVFKSNVFSIKCNKSINAEIEAPEEYPQWIEVANTKLNELDNAIGGVQTIKNDIEGLKRETSILDKEINVLVPRTTEALNKANDAVAITSNYDARITANKNSIDRVESNISNIGQELINVNVDINELRNFKASKEEVENKQDKLIAGENIKIDGNVISAIGGGSPQPIASNDTIPYFYLMLTSEEWEKAWEYQGDYECNLSGILDRNNFMEFFNKYFDKDKPNSFGIAITVINEWGNFTTYYKGTWASFPYANAYAMPMAMLKLRTYSDEELEESPHTEYAYQLRQEDFGSWNDNGVIHVIKDTLNLVFGLEEGQEKPESLMYTWLGSDEVLTIGENEEEY